MGRSSPLEQKRAADAISRMLSGLRARADDAAFTVQNYLFVSQDFPSALVVSVSDRFSNGRVHGQNKTFPPNTAEFAAELREARGDNQKAAPKYFKAEQVEPRSDESKAMVQAMVDSLHAPDDLKAAETRKADWAEQHRTIMAALDERASETGGDVASPELIRAIKEGNEK